MGKNSLGTMMTVTAEKAGIKGKFTNHSTCRTSISQLISHEVPPVVVAQLSGHKNVQSIMRYSTASRALQEGMCKVLTNSGEYHNRALPSTAAAAPALPAALPQVSLLYMYVHVVLGLLGLKKKIHVYAALGAAPPSPKRPYVVEELAADHAGMVRRQAFISQLSKKFENSKTFRKTNIWGKKHIED